MKAGLPFGTKQQSICVQVERERISLGHNSRPPSGSMTTNPEPVEDQLVAMVQASAEDLFPEQQPMEGQQDEDPPKSPKRGREPRGKGPTVNVSKAGQAIGAKKPSKKQSKQCRGCTLWYALEDIVAGASLCHKCRNKLDNIGRIARSQGRESWYKEVRANDVKLAQVVAEYTQLVSSQESKRVPKTVWLQTLEQVVSTSAFIIEQIGEMMSKKRYMSWSETSEGGKLSEAEAEAAWAEWLMRAQEPGAQNLGNAGTG